MRRTAHSALLRLLPALLLASGNGLATHASAGRPIAQSADDPPLIIRVASDTIRSYTPSFSIEVHAGSAALPVDQLLGIALEIEYSSPELIEVVPPFARNLIPGPFLGNPDSLLIAIPPDPPAGLIPIGMTRRNDQGGVSGFGVVFQANFRATGPLPDSVSISFRIRNTVNARRSDGSVINFAVADTPTTLSILRPPDFELTTAVDSARIVKGRTAAYPIALTPLNGFRGPATLELAPAFEGAATDFLRGTLSAAAPRDTLTISTDSLLVAGDYRLTLAASADSLRKTVPLALSVYEPPLGADAVDSIAISGTEFRLRLNLGDSLRPVQALRTLAFTLTYPPESPLVLTTDAAKPPEPGPLLGTRAVLNSDPDPQNGELGFTIDFDTTGAGIDGFGELAEIAFAVPLEAVDGTVVPFSLTNIRGEDVDGRRVYFDDSPHEVTVREVPDFVIEISPDTLIVPAGEAVTYVVGLRTNPSFSESVTLSAGALPALATATFDPMAISQNETSGLTIATDSTLVPGDYLIEVRGEAAGIERTARAALSVLPPPSFALQLRPATQSIFAGDSAVFEVELLSAISLDGPVALRVEGLESSPEIRSRLSVAALLPGEIATVAFATRQETPRREFTFRVVGSSGQLFRSAAGSFIVLEPPPPVRPNPFTPNSDGYNDFVIFDFDALTERGGDIRIFDLSGREIIRLRGRNRWDGKDASGKAQQPGAYLYVVQSAEGILARGVIGLAR